MQTSKMDVRVMDPGVSSRPVEVYLASAVVKGQIVARHGRLSDYLNAKTSDGTIRLEAAEIRSLKTNRVSERSSSILIYKRQILFVADLSSGNSFTAQDLGLRWARRLPHKVRMEVGTFWLEGEVHLVTGSELTSFAEGKSSFIPLTKARLINYFASEPRTFLINREKVNCLMAQSEAIQMELCDTRAAQN